MNNTHLARGLFLAAIGLTFGLNSLRYNLGSLGRAGPGLFPLLVSAMLLVIAIVGIVRSRFEQPIPLKLQVRNIGLLLGALCAFALLSKLVNMTAGIVAMVLIASIAGSQRSWKRSLQISAGLVAIAFAFQKLLGLNLPLL